MMIKPIQTEVNEILSDETCDEKCIDIEKSPFLVVGILLHQMKMKIHGGYIDFMHQKFSKNIKCISKTCFLKNIFGFVLKRIF